jgi:hypothetical protein
VPDVARHDERRRRLADRERLDVGARLAERAVHLGEPGAGVALGGADLGVPGVGALLGLEQEAAALVEIDEPGGVGAVGVVELRVALEDVGVLGGIAGLGIGVGHVEDVAEIAQEAVFVGALGAAGGRPLRQERREIHVRRA